MLSISSIVFSVLLTTRCNLRCNNCCYGCDSPNSNKDASLSLVLDSLSKLASLLSSYSGSIPISIVLMGGEPLLYPYLNNVLLYLKQHTNVSVSIVSNGLLMPKIKSNILNTIKECKYHLSITKYPIPNYNYQNIENKLKALQISYHFINDGKPQSYFWKHDYKLNSKEVPEGWTATNCREFIAGLACVPIWEDKLFTCTNIFEVYNKQQSSSKYLDIPIVKNSDYFNIKLFNSIQDIFNILDTKYAFCNHCFFNEKVPWSSNIKIKEV